MSLRAPQWQLDGRDPDWLDDECAPAQRGVEDRYGTAEYPAGPTVGWSCDAYCPRCQHGLVGDPPACATCTCFGCQMPLGEELVCSCCGLLNRAADHETSRWFAERARQRNAGALHRDDVRKAAA